MVILLMLSSISVILILLYLIVAHYILVMAISEDIEKTPSDVRLLPLDPKSNL
jgi:hypothetical protein